MIRELLHDSFRFVSLWRVALALVAATGCGLSSPPAAAQARPLAADEVRIEFLDVGQGDAALVLTGDGRRVLIDAGPDRDDVAALLRARGIDTVDLAVASHNHADHIGGMAAVLRGVVVRAYMDNGVPTTTATYRRTLDALEATGTRYLRASERTITVGPLLVLRVLPMPTASIGEGQNNRSVGVVVEYGAFRALFTGDAEHEERAFWRTSGRLPTAAVLKVAHHGSANGTDAAWLAAVRPSLAVISVGRGNTYGHPTARALRQLAARGVRTLRTDRQGEVRVTARADGSYGVSTGGSDSVVFARPAEPDTTRRFREQPPPAAVPAPAAARPPSPPPAAAIGCCRPCPANTVCDSSCAAREKSCRQ